MEDDAEAPVAVEAVVVETVARAGRTAGLHLGGVEAAAFERSDVTAVPAAGVIGEAMVALVLAGAMREKFGGDHVAEMRRNFEGYRAQLREY